jgi:crossover junction endodeoxyribonuclease RusA
MQPSLEFSLPWPPSVNHYWRNTINQGRQLVLISAEGRKYRLRVLSEILMQSVPRNGMAGSLNVDIAAFPPDKRRRDLDNILKSTLDALVHAGVIADDSFIDCLRVKRMPKEALGKILITISRMPIDDASSA